MLKDQYTSFNNSPYLIFKKHFLWGFVFLWVGVFWQTFWWGMNYIINFFHFMSFWHLPCNLNCFQKKEIEKALTNWLGCMISALAIFHSFDLF